MVERHHRAVAEPFEMLDPFDLEPEDDPVEEEECIAQQMVRQRPPHRDRHAEGATTATAIQIAVKLTPADCAAATASAETVMKKALSTLTAATTRARASTGAQPCRAAKTAPRRAPGDRQHRHVDREAPRGRVEEHMGEAERRRRRPGMGERPGRIERGRAHDRRGERCGDEDQPMAREPGGEARADRDGDGEDGEEAGDEIVGAADPVP